MAAARGGVAPPVTRHVIDAHLHMWERAKHPQPWIDPRTMGAIDRDFPPAAAQAQLDTVGVPGCVAVQCVNELAETVSLLADTAALRSVRGVVGWADLTGDVAAQVMRLRSGAGGDRLVGVRHVTFGEDDERWLARPDVGKGLDALGEAGLAYDVLVGAHQLRLAAEVVRAHEGTTFVLDHLGKVPVLGPGLADWARDLAVLGASPHLVVKVSGLVTEYGGVDWSADRVRPIIDHALESFGPDRLLFGSDWPLVEIAGGYRRWLDTYLELTDDLTPAEKAAMDGGNALRAYGLA